MLRRSFSGLRAKDALDLVPTRRTTPWSLETPKRPPSDILLAMLARFQKAFGLMGSEAAVMVVDTLLADVVPLHPGLKVWKGEPLEGNTVGGVADYLIAPNYGYVETPLLCAVEAKLDDFAAGETQCIAGYSLLRVMAACRDNNIRDGHDFEIHGIVSNGQGWVFYRLTRTPEVWVSGLFTMNDLPTLLGALDYVCAACAANLPRVLGSTTLPGA